MSGRNCAQQEQSAAHAGLERGAEKRRRWCRPRAEYPRAPESSAVRPCSPGPASIDLIVPDTIAALRSMIISEPSDATSLTGSIEPCARAVAFACRTTCCICGISPIMVAARGPPGAARLTQFLDAVLTTLGNRTFFSLSGITRVQRVDCCSVGGVIVWGN